MQKVLSPQCMGNNGLPFSSCGFCFNAAYEQLAFGENAASIRVRLLIECGIYRHKSLGVKVLIYKNYRFMDLQLLVSFVDVEQLTLRSHQAGVKTSLMF